MKFIKYLILGFLFVYLQLLLAPKLVILGIEPFLVISYIIFTAINLDFLQSSSAAFVIGIALDLLNPYLLGSHCIVFLLLTLLIDKYKGMIKKDNAGSIMINIMLINLFYLVIMISIKFIVISYDPIWLYLSPLELIYNSVFSVIILSLLFISQSLRVTVATKN